MTDSKQQHLGYSQNTYTVIADFPIELNHALGFFITRSVDHYLNTMLVSTS